MLFQIANKNNPDIFVIINSNDKTQYGKKIELGNASFEIDKIGSIKGNSGIKVDIITKMVIYTVKDFGVSIDSNGPATTYYDKYIVSDDGYLKLITQESNLENYSGLSIEQFNKKYEALPDYVKVELLTEKDYKNLFK